MKKVKVNWCEMGYYEAEIEIPDNIWMTEKELDWIMNNKFDWGGDTKPYEICTDWDSFEVEDVEE